MVHSLFRNFNFLGMTFLESNIVTSILDIEF